MMPLVVVTARAGGPFGFLQDLRQALERCARIIITQRMVGIGQEIQGAQDRLQIIAHEEFVGAPLRQGKPAGGIASFAGEPVAVPLDQFARRLAPVTGLQRAGLNHRTTELTWLQ